MVLEEGGNTIETEWEIQPVFFNTKKGEITDTNSLKSHSFSNKRITSPSQKD